MGVLACDRKGCENIMCNTYVRGIGYICSSCEREFKDLTEYDECLNTNGRIINALRQFAATQKGGEDDNTKMDVIGFFDNHRQ